MPTPMPPQLLLAPAHFVRLNGLWKTTNRGHTWRNVFSDQAVSTFGDVAIAPSDGSEGCYVNTNGASSWRPAAVDLHRPCMRSARFTSWRSSLSLMEALEGQAVRPGSLHPPTPEHIRSKTAIEDRLDRVLSSARDDR